MVPNYQSLHFSYEQPEKRGPKFWTCTESNIPEEMKETLKLDIQPRFLIFHCGELKKTVSGAKFVDLQNAINEFIPAEPDVWTKIYLEYILKAQI